MPEETKERADEAKNVKNAATDKAKDVGESGRDKAAEQSSNGQQTVTSELKRAVRQAAIEALKPAAVAATTAAATYAVKKGPDVFKNQVSDRVADAGGPKALIDKAGGPKALASAVPKGALLKAGTGALASKLKPGGKEGGGPEPSGTGRGRRLPIQDYVDVAVPIDKVYNQWTQFEDFPKFMHRVERVEQRDETHLMWHENIWGVRRQWEAEITEQHPEERIAWKSTGGPKQVGVVTFSKLADNLTRVQVSLDFQPKGLFEKTASGTRITRRALKSDLMRFKAFIEMGYEETGAWRGEIADGELQEGEDQDAQDQHAEDEDFDDEESEDQRAEDSDDEYEDDEDSDDQRDEDSDDEYEDEDSDDQRDEDADDEEGEEPEEEEQRPRSSRKAPARRPRSSSSSTRSRRQPAKARG